MAVRLVNACVPLVSLAPLQPPVAVQAVALVEVHVTVELPPHATVVRLAEIVTVGAGITGFAIEKTTVVLVEMLPAGSLQNT